MDESLFEVRKNSIIDEWNAKRFSKAAYRCKMIREETENGKDASAEQIGWLRYAEFRSSFGAECFEEAYKHYHKNESYSWAQTSFYSQWCNENLIVVLQKVNKPEELLVAFRKLINSWRNRKNWRLNKRAQMISALDSLKQIDSCHLNLDIVIELIQSDDSFGVGHCIQALVDNALISKSKTLMEYAEALFDDYYLYNDSDKTDELFGHIQQGIALDFNPFWWDSNAKDSDVFAISDGIDCITDAISNNDHKRLKECLDAGSSLFRKDTQNETPIFHAVRREDSEMINLLIESGSDLEGCNVNQETPMSLAVELDNAALLRLLLGKGVNPYQNERPGLDAVQYAVNNAKTSCLEVFRSRGYL
jgi:hypothetical protein